MKVILIILTCLFTVSLSAQEDIEKYLLTDSLEIQSLVDENVVREEEEQPNVAIFTNIGLAGKKFTNLDDLNTSLLAQGYGEIPAASMGWIWGNRVDIGDHFSFGTTLFSNLLVNSLNEGVTNTSRFTFVDFLFDFGYRTELGKLQLAPGLGLGVSQSFLSLRPNGVDEMDWDDMYLNNGLVVAVRQVDLALSTDLSLGTYIQKKEGRKRLLNLKLGMIFHPFSFAKPGIYTGDVTAVKLKNAPSLSSTGVHLILTWG